VEDPSWVVVNDWPPSALVMYELPSFVVVVCPEPDTGITIGGTGLLFLSAARSEAGRPRAKAMREGSFMTTTRIRIATILVYSRQ
jgi:hypothetical protein